MSEVETGTLTELEVAQRLADSYYLRRGVRYRPEAFLAEVQRKFNPYHDPDNGQFTFAPGKSKLGRSTSSQAPSTSSGRVRYPVRVELPSYPTRIELPPSRPANVPIPKQAAKPAEPLAKRFPHSSGIDLPDEVVAKANTLSDSVRIATGHQIHVTSGRRNPDRQAEAMYNNYKFAENPPRYANRAAEAEIKVIFDRGNARGLSRRSIIGLMANALQQQTKRGIYLSKHMRSNALDIRTPPAKVIEAIRRNPTVQSEIEENEHVHIQFR